MYPHDEICSKDHWCITCSAVGMLYTGRGEHVVEGEIALLQDRIWQTSESLWLASGVSAQCSTAI